MLPIDWSWYDLLTLTGTSLTNVWLVTFTLTRTTIATTAIGATIRTETIGTGRTSEAVNTGARALPTDTIQLVAWWITQTAIQRELLRHR